MSGKEGIIRAQYGRQRNCHPSQGYFRDNTGSEMSRKYLCSRRQLWWCEELVEGERLTALDICAHSCHVICGRVSFTCADVRLSCGNRIHWHRWWYCASLALRTAVVFHFILCLSTVICLEDYSDVQLISVRNEIRYKAWVLVSIGGPTPYL